MIVFIELKYLRKEIKEKRKFLFEGTSEILLTDLSGLTPEERQIYPGQLPYTRRMRFPFQDFSCT